MATRGVPSMKMPTTSCCIVQLLFLVILIATAITPALAGHSHPPSTLVLYVHENRLPPNRTNVIVAPPSASDTNLVFGTTVVVANVLRTGEASDSPVLGQLDGQIIVEKDQSLALFNTYVLSTGSFSGSISVQGVTDPLGNGELAITGGTYDFRWARGYLELSLISQENPEDAVFKNIFHLKYD